jgi:death-on-curing protein
VEPVFLTLEEILAIHDDRIRRYGGSFGLRDLGLLESAIGSVGATFEGRFLHDTVTEMSATYLHTICRNHPFLDGNKRTALASALTFLRLNGMTFTYDPDELYDLVIRSAEGRVSKAEIAVFLQNGVTQ